MLLAISTTEARSQRDNKPASTGGRRPGSQVAREEDEFDEDDLCGLYGEECGSEDGSDDESLEDSGSEDEDAFVNLVSHHNTDTSGDSTLNDAQKFSAWAARFNKHYRSHNEYEERMGRWTETEQIVHDANAAADASGRADAPRLTVDTPYADGNVRTGRLSSGGRRLEAEEVHEPRNLQDVAAIDWVAANKTTAVKDQGNCGSCYAFAANTVLEAAIAITEDTEPVRLSEQQVVDCSTSNYACQGGLETLVW